MISLKLKRRILIKYQNGDSISGIAREVGSSRSTVRKYITTYEEKITKLKTSAENNDGEIDALVEELSSQPRYDSTGRFKRKLSSEIIGIIDECLKQNEFKLLNRNRKQMMKGIDIYELLKEKDYDIGYTTVCNYIRKTILKKEAFVKQEYQPGETVEFDWGEVKLKIAGKALKFQLALFSTGYGSYNFGYLYNNQKMQSFLDVHVKCFSHLGGVHKEVVYDNMRVAVKKFVGKTEKIATDELIKISMYYGFNYRFCNARRGNEKGTVERAIEFVRRKAFSSKDEFNSLEEANYHLQTILNNLNNKPTKYLGNVSPKDKLNEEKDKLIKVITDYVICTDTECRVDKYSTITIEQNRYSVSELLVGKFVKAKVYPERVDVIFENKVIASHMRSYKFSYWTIDINHYISTFKKKPGALHNSTAMHNCSHRIKNIYHSYYTNNPREFIDLIELIKITSLENVEKAITELEKLGQRHVTTGKIKNIVTQEKMKIHDNPINEDDEILTSSLSLLNMLSEAVQGGIVN
jgi:transposase/transposase-like protein